jgi:hypothetical protein
MANEIRRSCQIILPVAPRAFGSTAEVQECAIKTTSAQEAIDKREKLERETKTKNLELADMIRERDRALHEKDFFQGGNREEMEKLKRELRIALDRADSLERSKGNELSSLLFEMADLEEALRKKSHALEDFHAKYSKGGSEAERLLREREEELEVYSRAWMIP